MGCPELLNEGLGKLPQIMHQLGYESLRAGQDRVVFSLMSGNDVIGILPTGAGKTSCFTIPSLCHEWPLLVFSPLQALMRDQCRGLWEKGIPAGRLSGDQTEGENDSVIQGWNSGKLSIMFVAPERMKNTHFMNAVQKRPPKMVAVDEAHTISQWSDNFRPSYAKIGDFLEKLNHKVEVIAAFSATLPPTAEEDVRRVLKIPEATRVKHYPKRKNLLLSSSVLEGRNDLLDVLDNISGSCIVYCSTRKNVEEVAAWLSTKPGYDCLVAPYHAGLPQDLRRQYQDDFMNNRVRVIVATNAFGMGVDKPDIRGVIHYDFPASVEALVQEVGRGGRDGGDTICHTFYRQENENTQEFLIRISNPDSGTVRKVYSYLNVAAGGLGGEVRLSNFQLARSSKSDEKSISASLSYLTAAGVIDRNRQKDSIARIRFPDEETPDGRERRDKADKVSTLYETYESLARRVGVLQPDGFIKFDIQLLADQLSVQESTVRSNINKWQTMDLLTFEPPFSGMITRVVGPPEDVDWERIDQKRKDSWTKLNDVLEYLNVEDAEKHEFLDKYFREA